MCARMFPPCDSLPSPIIFPQPIPNESTISKEPNTKFHENRNIPLSTMWPSSRNPACRTAHTLQSTTASIPAQESPNTEVTEPLGTTEPPSSAAPPTARRRRKIQPLYPPSKPPQSANHISVAEDGSYRTIFTPPNLHHRRPMEDSPNTEVVTPLPALQTSPIGERTNLSPNTEVRDPAPDHQTSIFGEPTCQSPNTEVTTPPPGPQTSTIGDQRRIRRTRKIHPLPHTV